MWEVTGRTGLYSCYIERRLNVRGYLHCFIMKCWFSIQNHKTVSPGYLGGLHNDIVESTEPCSGCKMDGEEGGEAVQLGLFKREMDRGSEQGTNIPLQRAHDSASICTPLSLSPIHHSLAAPTSHFYLTSLLPPSLSLKTCVGYKSSWISAVS